MSEEEVSPSDIYLSDNVVFEKGKKYLVKANSGHGKSSFLNFIYGSNISYSGTIDYENGQEKNNLFVAILVYLTLHTFHQMYLSSFL